MTDEPQQAEQQKDPVAEVIPQIKMNEARQAAQAIPIGDYGSAPPNFAAMIDVAKPMANSKEAVPAHVRGNLGMCIALFEMAYTWGLAPYLLANESSVINGRLGFTSHVFRTIMDTRAGLRGRLRVSYVGEGEERICIVTGHFKTELDPLSYTTPSLKQIRPATNEKGEIKGSQLWKTDPDRQMFYYASRAFCRMYCPAVMLGYRGADELADAVGKPIAAEEAIDVTPSDTEALAARLRNAMPQEGFSHKHVEKALNHKPKSKKRGKR